MQGLDITLAHTTTATTAKTKNVSINLTGVIQCGGIARYGKVVIDMRCIDANALKDGYMHMGYDPNEHPEESYMEGWCKGFNAAVDHCIGHVIYAPTIEPERKKGKWLPDNNNYYEERFICSVCGKSYKVDTCMGKPMWDFCPCGADMREEGEK